jgi:hypothetical protein
MGVVQLHPYKLLECLDHDLFTVCSKLNGETTNVRGRLVQSDLVITSEVSGYLGIGETIDPMVRLALDL